MFKINKLEDKHEQELLKLKQDIEMLNSKYAKEKQDYEQNMLKLKKDLGLSFDDIVVTLVPDS